MIPSAVDPRADFRERGAVVIDSGVEPGLLDEARLAIPTIENRVQDQWRYSEAIHAIATAPSVLDTLRELYAAEPLPFQTLNFQWGTQQPAHADSIHFNSEPFGLMCGVWVALEDVGPEQGPLIYYPGSHDLPEMNLDYFGLPASMSNYDAYEKAIVSLIDERGFQPEYGTVSKGQAIVWSANILHGGAPRVDSELTRWSHVTHYYFDGAVAWRPLLSENGRRNFEPDWLPNVWSKPTRRHLLARRLRTAAKPVVKRLLPSSGGTS